MTEQEFNTWLEEHREQLEAIRLTWRLTGVGGRGGYLASIALGMSKPAAGGSFTHRVECGESAITRFNRP